MDCFFLISCVICSACQSLLCGAFNKKTTQYSGTASLYTLLLIGSAFLSWCVMLAMDGQISASVLPYAVLFALCYTAANWALARALRTGSVAVTSLMMQLSLIGATIWGFLFWNTAFTWPTALGLLLVVLSLWLCLRTGKTEKRRNVRWLVYAALLFAANAGCTIVQKTQQLHSNGQYGTFFMVMAVGLSALVNMAGLCGRGKSIPWKCLRGSWYFPVIAGVSNGLMNWFVIQLANSSLSPSLVYPVIAVGGLAVTTLCSALLFRERINRQQWIGIVIGAVAVAILSI